MRYKPTLPVPPPLRGVDRGSFAEHTVKRRLPDIARRVLAENTLPPEAAAALEGLIADLPNAPLRPLTDTHAPDHTLWQAAIEPYHNQNWLQVPWFFAETYFFRRIIEAVDYFNTDLDPFAVQKQQGLVTYEGAITTLLEPPSPTRPTGWNQETFSRLLLADLWGNQVDLSLWPADAADKPDHTDEETRQAHLLVDARPAVTSYIDTLPLARADFITDNSGLELLGDLALADYLLTSGKCSNLHFHVKQHPTFVSDATATDVLATLSYLGQQPSLAGQEMAFRLVLCMSNGRFHLQTHPFWTSPHPLWQMPDDLRRELARTHLIICKGDANYRRALGDAHWPYTTPLADIISYCPAPILFLRTCKSPVLAGLVPGQPEKMTAATADWVTSGRWGVIQFVGKSDD